MARRRRQNAGAEFAAAVIVMIVLGLSGYIRLPAAFWLSLGAFVAVVIAIWVVTRRPSLSPARSKPKSIAPDTSTWSLELLKALDWKRFEELCTWYFQESGHTAKVTGAGADGGVDIWIYDAADAGTVSGVAQCKAWTDKQVGVKEVRELFGVMNHVGCRYGVFFGMSGFTEDARSFAANKEIDLVSAEQLLDLIAVLSREVQASLLARATSGDYATPSCPSCGIKLVVRTASKGVRAGRQFWGCSNYPRCKYVMN